jgi:hypothetical protein
MNVRGPLVVSHWDMEMKLPSVSVVSPGGGSLTINQEPASEASGGVAGRDIDHRTHAVASTGWIVGDQQHVFPEPFALRFGPTVVTLKNRDNELRRSIIDFCKWAVNCFHRSLSKFDEPARVGKNARVIVGSQLLATILARRDRLTSLPCHNDLRIQLLRRLLEPLRLTLGIET